ncbi:MAG TPA: phosphotransferase [Actinomycetes bacterium]|nr:phosphotransferase [Actinomycetes bacterium]
MTQPLIARPARPEWGELPATVRSGIEHASGGSLFSVESMAGGYGPGMASLLQRDDGARFFVKAISASINPQGPDIYGRERDILERLPLDAPISQLVATFTDGQWLALIFGEVIGRNPEWSREGDLDLVLSSMTDLARAMSPPPAPAPRAADLWDEDFAGFRRLAATKAHFEPAVRARYGDWAADGLDRLATLEASGASAVVGETLLHGDLRDDNMLITPAGEVVFVDWPEACIGPAWFDLLLMLPSVALTIGLDAVEQVVATHGSIADVDSRAVDAALTGVAGYFVHSSLQPPPPGLPTVREFQRVQGLAAVEWLQQRHAV